MVTERLAAQAWSEVVTTHGEGPCWDPAVDALRCVDLLAGELLTFDDDAVPVRRRYDDVVAAWRPRADGGLVLGTERGFALIDADGEVGHQVGAWDDPSVRMNDGACDPAGRFYCGSMAYDTATGRGTLWRLDPDRSVRAVLRDVTISNGLSWRPDGSSAYYVDTPTQRVDRLVVDHRGEIAAREPFVTVDPADGAPDGLTVDAHGGVWVALWGGGAVHRYDPDGALTHVVEVGARQVTACTFGGAGLDRLFVTTSRHGVRAGDDPAAGSVFVVDPGLRGVPAFSFAG